MNPLRILRTASAAPSRRLFSTTARRDATYGFIGLGKMGLPMARNLRTKLPKDDTLYVYDVNRAATESLRQEFASGIEVASGVGEVVEHSVSSHPAAAFVRSRRGAFTMMNVIFSHNTYEVLSWVDFGRLVFND
jgi:3-hydroxyisobutyrate dehydrogenase